MLKKILVVAAFLIASFTVGFGQDSWTAAATEAVEKAEKEISKARRKSDTKALERIYADDFEGINAAGIETSRSQILTYYDGSKGSGDRVNETDQEKIRIFDKTAVVTARLEYKPGGSDGETVWMRYTRIYAFRNNAWVVVAEHYSLLKDGTD